MNLFYLDTDPRKAAMYHGDKHVVKMIIETAQALGVAHHVLDGDLEKGDRVINHDMIYRITHRNHPVMTWVRSSRYNYEYASCLLDSLCEEFIHRRRKFHNTHKLSDLLYEPPINIPMSSFTNPPLCMPDRFKVDNPVESYRRYYHQKRKDGVVTYEWGRPMPDWMSGVIRDV